MSLPASGAQKQRTDSEKVLFIVCFLFLILVFCVSLKVAAIVEGGWGDGGKGCA